MNAGANFSNDPRAEQKVHDGHFAPEQIAGLLKEAFQYSGRQILRYGNGTAKSTMIEWSAHEGWVRAYLGTTTEVDAREHLDATAPNMAGSVKDILVGNHYLTSYAIRIARTGQSSSAASEGVMHHYYAEFHAAHFNQPRLWAVKRAQEIVHTLNDYFVDRPLNRSRWTHQRSGDQICTRLQAVSEPELSGAELSAVDRKKERIFSELKEIGVIDSTARWSIMVESPVQKRNERRELFAVLVMEAADFQDLNLLRAMKASFEKDDRHARSLGLMRGLIVFAVESAMKQWSQQRQSSDAVIPQNLRVSTVNVMEPTALDPVPSIELRFHSSQAAGVFNGIMIEMGVSASDTSETVWIPDARDKTFLKWVLKDLQL